MVNFTVSILPQWNTPTYVHICHVQMEMYKHKLNNFNKSEWPLPLSAYVTGMCWWNSASASLARAGQQAWGLSPRTKKAREKIEDVRRKPGSPPAYQRLAWLSFFFFFFFVSSFFPLLVFTWVHPRTTFLHLHALSQQFFMVSWSQLVFSILKTPSINL